MSDIFEKRTLRDALRVVFRRWHVFLVATSAFAIALIYLAHYWPLSYTGATLFERRIDPAVDNLKGESFEVMKRTLIHRLGGREAVERVIEELGVTRGLSHGPDGRLTLSGNMARQELVAEFQKRLKIDFRVQSPTIDLVSVQFTHEDPELASRVPNVLVTNYMEWVHKNIYERLGASREFLAKQGAKCKGRLGELEQQRLEFEVKHAGMFPDSPDALQTRINAVHSDLDTLRLQQKKAKKELARLESLASQVAQSTPEGAKKASQVELEYARLHTLLRYTREELDVALTVKGYTELHPEVKVLRGNIARLEARVADLEAKLPAGVETVASNDPLPRPENLQTALAAVRSEVEVTTAEIERLENRLKELESLMANYTVIRQQYSEILGKIRDEQGEAARWKSREDEIQMALEAEAAKRRTHLESVQAAERQFRPSSPALLRVLGLAYVGGLAFGSGIVFLLNFLDRSVGTTEEASKYFSVPIHGVIGEIVTARRRFQKMIRRYLVGPLIALAVLCVLGIATFSITLWLKAPEKFGEWRAAPVRFVYDHTMTVAEQLWQRIRS
ncbi:MAG TPA: hypothetical protein VM537_06820 [Anaerolineae bacterium]|nr:hypothetical protein [Anaerolineae bacterium]